MHPLTFLSVPIYGFIPFSKAAKWDRRILVVFSIWLSMLAPIPSTSSGIWTQALKFMRLCLHFGSDWYGWTVITNNKKIPDHLWDAVNGSITLLCFPSSSWINKYFKVKKAWSDTSMVWPQKSKSLLIPFSTWVSTRSPMSTKRDHRAPTFWCSLIFLLRWPALFICKNCAFCLWKSWFQPYLEPDMNTCYILLFTSPQERLIFLLAFFGSFLAGSCLWGSVLWGNTCPSSEFQIPYLKKSKYPW